MRIGWRAAAVLVVVLAAGAGTVLALSLGSAGSSDEPLKTEVTVRFNTSVTQENIDEVGALLRAHDEHLDFLIMESFPPIGRAEMSSDGPDFCDTVEAELEAKAYVDEVTCGPWAAPLDEDPDAPVSADR